MAKRCLSSVIINDAEYNCTILSEMALNNLADNSYDFKPSSQPAYDGRIVTFGDIWISTTNIFSIPSYKYEVNENPDLTIELTDTYSDPTYGNLRDLKCILNVGGGSVIQAQLTRQLTNAYGCDNYYWGFVVDDETQKAWIISATTSITAIDYSSIRVVYESTGALYNALTQPPITYNWQSVPSISGKNGILSLTHVRNDSLLDGGSQTFTPEQVYVTEESRVGKIMANVPIGKAIRAIYSGVANYLGIMKDTASSFTVILQLVEHITRRIYLKSFVTDKCYIGFILDADQEAARVGIFYPQYDPQTEILTGYTVNFTDTDYSESDIWDWLQGGIDPDTDGPEVNEEDEGTLDEYQPDIAITGITKPSYGAIDTGFTTMYRMSKGELQRLSNFLWTDSFVSNVKKFFNDPREIIVGLSIMPVLPDTEAAPGSEVKAGGISTGVYGLKLTDQYKLETYGVIEVKAEKGNFLDYAPYTQVTAHLPFVGAHSLDVNDVMGKQLALKYIFDFLTGSCVAEIDVYDEEAGELKPRYFFGGSCGIQVPSSSEDFSRMYSSILSAGATLGSALSTIATGGLTAPLLLGTASNMLANGMNGSPSVEFSSGSGSVNGMIGCKAAYLVISRPKEKVAKNQQKYVGKPSFMTRTLSSCSGYTKCLNVHLDNVPCTATERAEIERLLLDGVRIATGSTTPSYTPTTNTDHGLIFLKCTSDMDVIGKSWDEEHTLTVEGKLLFDQDMLTPKFVLQADTLAYNYCYIPDFGRFYYVTKQLIKTGSLTEIHLQCDVLQSWKTQILSNKAVIERSANDSNVNAYFSDSMYWTQANKEVKTVPFLDRDGNDLVFEIPENNYILTIAGSD